MALHVIVSASLLGAMASNDSWTVTSLAQVNENVTSLGTSCGLSIALDTMQPCPHECSRFCGIDQRDPYMWTRRVASGAELAGAASLFTTERSDSDTSCMQDNPLCVAPKGSYSIFESSRELSLETGYALLSDAKLRTPWIPYGKPVVNVDSDGGSQKGLTLVKCRRMEYHRSAILSAEDLANLISPLRLGHLSLRMDNRYLASEKGLYSEYIRVGYEVKPEIDDSVHFFYPDLGMPSSTDIPRMIYDGSIYFNTKVKRAIPSALPIKETNFERIGSGGGATPFIESYVDTVSRTELVGRLQLSPTIHALVQQWFLRHGTDSPLPRLAVTISRAYPAYSKNKGEMDSAARLGEAGVHVNSAEFDSASESDSVVKVESLSVLSYSGLTVSPACSDRSNCASCVATGTCAWCNMAEANVRRDVHTWAGWFASSKARHQDGSACGIPPQVCAMLGGEPNVSYCPPTWKDEWDLYRE